ncbi:hypothetical protein CERSUDRAFT_115679 [Gelatoporia subvermispora B]|uniref:F-box domain-containing protein n=1 Tax=Ceriporiopsis subvermispora (strain B) TaxID=914234 RepID=M2QUG4_CERS8|nr:hypothetical protein CERSUDRAFT_115679 [Gelatoporia subvermispora B]
MYQTINGSAAAALLLDLPEELLLEVLKNLDFRSILRCCCVCRLLQSAIKGSLELQYKIELYADGLVDGPPIPNLTTADRLHLLLERRRRWRSLDWRRMESIPITGGCQAYELVDGVFAKSMSTAFAGGSRHFTTVRLPTQAEPARTIVRENLGVPTRDFAMDPSQDLLALVHNDEGNVGPPRIVIHFRTLSTNEVHPKASLAQLEAPMPLRTENSLIQVADDVVALFYWAHGPGILIWNWQKGILLVNLTQNSIRRDVLPPMVWDFAFLSNRAFLVTTIAGVGTIEIYAFRGDVALEGGLEKPNSARRVASLGMPPIKQTQELHAFNTHSGPFVHRPGTGQLFHTASDMCAHLFELNYGEHGRRFLLFVPNRFFLSFVPKEGEIAGVRHTIEQSWNEWGPLNSRVLHRRGRFQWLRYIHGHRLVLPLALPPSPPDTMIRERLLIVCDFNVHPKRINDPVEKPDNCEIVTVPEVIPADDTFKEEVITYLPYARSLKIVTFNYSGLMIDDERIVGMKSLAFADGDMTDIDVFMF